MTYFVEVGTGEWPTCTRCGALVPPETQPAHMGWHGEIDQLISVVRSLGRVTATVGAGGAVASGVDYERTAAYGAEGGS